ncbi:MAG: nicotinate-nucleotide--dimethylbenzimidazole phosphoribosyltransferase, partial [Alphaproteobacteria bacterium]|nr:nicotinate-nucleotide--dimethylbenzimidazole phosphoribosyltransferase [Alphaproteobacteria bacterium]
MTENPAARFAEIRALLAALPGADADADADAVHAKPPRSWPGGDPLVRWLAAWQGRARPRLDRPRLLLFAARHGIGAEPADAIAARLAALVDGAAPAHTRAAALDVDMRAFDMAIAIPTRDARAGPATTEAECVRDVAYGMMAVEPGLDLLVLATFAAGEAHVVPALAAALGHPPAPR